MWFKNFVANPDSKTQKEKSAKTIRYVGCNKCHRTDVTLIKGKDSYYCKECLIKISKKEK